MASTSSAFQDITSAASKFNIDPTILLGVYGAESNFGKAYSAGQKTYGYFGLTSPGLWNPGMTFQQDADTAAATLAGLYQKNGKSWDAALRAYSGGGYGLSHVQALASQKATGTGSIFGLIPGLPGLPSVPTPSISSPLSGVSGAITGVWNSVVNDAKYAAVMVVMLLIGAFLIFHGLSGVASGGNQQRSYVPVPV